MDDLSKSRELRSFVYGEIGFVIMACLFGGFGWWTMFAISALLCVLVPLWMIVLCTFICAAPVLNGMENSAT